MSAVVLHVLETSMEERRPNILPTRVLLYQVLWAFFVKFGLFQYKIFCSCISIATKYFLFRGVLFPCSFLYLPLPFPVFADKIWVSHHHNRHIQVVIVLGIVPTIDNCIQRSFLPVINRNDQNNKWWWHVSHSSNQKLLSLHKMHAKKESSITVVSSSMTSTLSSSSWFLCSIKIRICIL